MALSRERIRDLYRVRAKRYDMTANIYYLIGFREQHYRREAVSALGLATGDTVVEIGCGTGLNFPLLQKRIGPDGRIVGVDLTDRMLEQARRQVEGGGWNNVELVQADAATFSFPEGVQGILSSFALTLVPEYDRVIQAARQTLCPGGRLAILDLKESSTAPDWMTRSMVRLTRPFGVTLDLAERHPWESVERHFDETFFREFFFGYAYLSVGTVRGAEDSLVGEFSEPLKGVKP